MVGQESNLKKARRTGVVYLACSRTGAGVHPNYAQSPKMDFMLLGTEALTPCMAKIALVMEVNIADGKFFMNKVVFMMS